MPLAAPVTSTVNPLTDRLSCLKSDICFFSEISAAMLSAQTKFEAFTMNELDFSGKQVLVVGGSSGIGNGIAQAFRARGARVHVCGTRAQAADYSPAEGSHLGR